MHMMAHHGEYATRVGGYVRSKHHSINMVVVVVVMLHQQQPVVLGRAQQCPYNSPKRVCVCVSTLGCPFCAHVSYTFIAHINIICSRYLCSIIKYIHCAQQVHSVFLLGTEMIGRQIAWPSYRMWRSLCAQLFITRDRLKTTIAVSTIISTLCAQRRRHTNRYRVVVLEFVCPSHSSDHNCLDLPQFATDHPTHKNKHTHTHVHYLCSPSPTNRCTFLYVCVCARMFMTSPLFYNLGSRTVIRCSYN